MRFFRRAPSPTTRIARALLALTIGLGVTAVAPQPSGAATMTAPPWVKVVAAPGGGTATVTWAPVTSGPIDQYVVDILVDGTWVKAARCASDCTSREVRNLPPGRTVRISVFPQTAGVNGPYTLSAPLVVPPACATGAPQCIQVDGTSDAGPITGVAQGFLHSNGPGLDPTRVAALRPRSWRVRAVAGSYQSFDAARAQGAPILLLVSDAIPAPTTDPAAAGTLTGFLTTYRAQVRSYVQRLIADGRLPEWWEVQNEPDLLRWRPSTQLAQWQAAYEEIRALVPSARIIGPAPGRFMDTPVNAGPYGLDLRTFLAFAVQKGLRPAAVGWHENSVPNPFDFEMQPPVIGDHVARARQLLAASGLADVPIRIDEYSGPQDGPIPGWQVGWFTALEAARVSAAQHACFPFPNGVLTHDGCETPNLDNALVPTDQSPRANYWIELAYGQMTGRRLATSTSAATLSTLAAAATGGAITALVGRHVDCLPVANVLCPLQGHSRPAAVDIPLTVTVPSTTAAMRAVVQRVPFSSTAMTGPTQVSDTVVVASAGAVTVTLPKVADGDALIVRLTPTSVPTAAPPSVTLETSLQLALRSLGL
jgi:hypothetical protein